MEEIKYIEPDRFLLEKVDLRRLERFYFPLKFPLSDLDIRFQFPLWYRYRFNLFTDKILGAIYRDYFILQKADKEVGEFSVRIPKVTLLGFYKVQKLVSFDQLTSGMKILSQVVDAEEKIVNYWVEVVELNPFKSFLYTVDRIDNQGLEYEMLTGKFEISI